MNESEKQDSPAEFGQTRRSAGEHAGTRESTVSEILVASLVLNGFKLLVRAFARMFLGKTEVPTPAEDASEKSPRAADRVVAHETATAQRWGMTWVVCAFILAIAAGVGFVFVYWTVGSNWLLGGALAVFLAGVGSSLVIYSHRLMTKHQATGPREPASSPPSERDRAFEDFCAGCGDVRRRGLVEWIGIGAVGITTAMVVSLFRSFGASPTPELFDTVWKRGQRLAKLDGTHVSVDALQPGSTIVVFPEDSIGDVKAQTLLIRVDEHRLQLPAARANWAPMGYVAYSRVCTHAGCPVGMFETTTDLLMCPCHQSTFNILKGAQPTGGPAARPLPQLPLYAGSDGILRAGGGFSEPPGPGFWQLR